MLIWIFSVWFLQTINRKRLRFTFLLLALWFVYLSLAMHSPTGLPPPYGCVLTVISRHIFLIVTTNLFPPPPFETVIEREGERERVQNSSHQRFVLFPQSPQSLSAAAPGYVFALQIGADFMWSVKSYFTAINFVVKWLGVPHECKKRRVACRWFNAESHLLSVYPSWFNGQPNSSWYCL